MGIPENRTRMVVAFLYLLYIQLLLTEYVQCNVTQKHTQTPDDSSTTVTKIEQNECQTNADCVGSPICKYTPNPKHCLCKKYCLEPSRTHPTSKTDFRAKCPKMCVTTSTSARTTLTTTTKTFKIEKNECQTNMDCVGSPICKYAPNPKHCLCKKYCLEPSRTHPRSKTNFTAKCPKLCVTTSTSARTTSTTNSKYFKSPCQSKEDCVKMAVCKDSETRSKKMRPFYYKGI